MKLNLGIPKANQECSRSWILIRKATSPPAVSHFYFNETAFIERTLLLIEVASKLGIARATTWIRTAWMLVRKATPRPMIGRDQNLPAEGYVIRILARDPQTGMRSPLTDLEDCQSSMI